MKNLKEFGSFNEGESGGNYMFWQNLETMKHAIEEMLAMDRAEIEAVLAQHAWAVDHIATSTDDVEEVYHFLSAPKEIPNLPEAPEKTEEES